MELATLPRVVLESLSTTEETTGYHRLSWLHLSSKSILHNIAHIVLEKLIHQITGIVQPNTMEQLQGKPRSLGLERKTATRPQTATAACSPFCETFRLESRAGLRRTEAGKSTRLPSGEGIKIGTHSAFTSLVQQKFVCVARVAQAYVPGHLYWRL